MKDTQSNHRPVYPTEPLHWGEPSFLRLRESEPSQALSDYTLSSAGASDRWLRALKGLVLFVSVVALSYTGYELASRYLAPTIIVQDNSMIPTLQEGSRFTLNRWSYLRHPPRRGDLVVMNAGHDEYAVKRVIATPCDSVHFKHGQLLINGERLHERYLPEGTQSFASKAPETFMVVGKDRYFVVGDNRAHADESSFGSVPRKQIVGAIAPENGVSK